MLSTLPKSILLVEWGIIFLYVVISLSDTLKILVLWLYISSILDGLSVPIPTNPLLAITIFIVPCVINCNSSLSALALVSASILVSWSTSITPPSDPQAFSAPKPSNCFDSVL